MPKPSEKYLKMMKMARSLAKFCGADVTDPNYCMNFMTVIVIICILMYFTCVMHTIQLKIAEDWKVLLEAFSLCGTAFQGLAKLIGGIFYSKTLCVINIELITIYKNFETKNESYVKVLNKCLIKIKYLLVISVLVYLIIYVWMFVAPAVMNRITGKRYLLMLLYFPYLDLDEDFGYTTTVVAQGIILVFSGFGNYAGDLLFIINHMHVTLFSNMLKLKIEELNIITDEDSDNTNIVASKLKDILEWHQKYSRYADKENRIFIWVILTEVATSSISVMLTLFIVMKGDWPGAYAYFVLQLFVLYLYCGMGTLVEITNDDFCEEIYAIHWYNLTVSQQKCVLLMLMKSQDPNLVTVGGVMPLSVSTGLQITKTVYSVLMMIVNFVE